jgi:hypothetical protein
MMIGEFRPVEGRGSPNFLFAIRSESTLHIREKPVIRPSDRQIPQR